MADDKTDDDKTLTEDDVITERGESSVGRRAATALLSVGGAGAAMALVSGCGGYAGRRRRRIGVRVSSGITDSDAGRNCADPAGGGRGPTGVTDSDNNGFCRNQVGRGRQGGGRVVVQTSGITDSDGGPCADPGGGGRGYSGMTDSDGGSCADPGGRGRRGY